LTEHLDRTAILALDERTTEERQALLAHVASCPQCRALVARVAPERLFSLLALDTIDPRALDRLSESVARAVRAEPSASSGGRVLRAASLAASLLLAALLGTYLFTARVGGRVEPAPQTVAPLAAEVAQQPTSSGFELVAPAEAEVVRVQVGDTELVMVFDEALEL
jgi:predicted anti-sigma-YlaC factor YlaD